MMWNEVKGMLSFAFFLGVALGILVGIICGKYIIRQPQETKTEITSSNEHRENLGIMLITKYHLDECKNKKTKTGETPAVGTCAISPDLRDILWMNDWIYVEGYGKLRVNTLTHPKYKRVIDIYTDDIKKANDGAVRKRVYLLKEK